MYLIVVLVSVFFRVLYIFLFFFSSRRRHTRCLSDWSSDVCSSDLIFVTPHNSGYTYSLSDPTNLGTKTYAQLDTFVHDGGGWTALCHSILSNENAIAALTTNGGASVKALFQTSQAGGVPGGFLTTNGFSTIDNTGGTWNVLTPGMPTAQGVPTSAANTLPGGSVQTWPAPGNAGAPTYYANTSRVATFTASGVSHDNIIRGIY